MENEICTIDLTNNSLDNEYTIYENGKIKHFYDRNAFRLNQEEWLTANELTESTKRLLIEKCPLEHEEKVRLILYP